ncbi:MAG: hypothetical protein ACOH17_13770 [Cellulomonas sp.]
MRPPRWKVAVAIGEGLRNWRNGRWLTILATVFIIAALALPALADGLGISRLVEDERAWEQAGGRMLVVTNDTAGGIDRAACEAAGRVDGVVASASLTRLPVRAGVPNAPDAKLPLVAVSEGIGPLLGLEPSAGGAILPLEIADGIGIHEGSSIRLTADVDPKAPSLATLLPDGLITVGAVADTSVLGEDYAYAVLLPTSASGLAAMCVVRVAPGYLESMRTSLPAMLSVAGHDSIVADRLIRGAYARDFSDGYATRGLKQSPWLVGAAISLLWLLLVWMRRARDGLYATLGADRSTRTIVRATEGLALIGASVLIGVVVVSGVLVLTATHPGAVVHDMIRHLTIATSVAVLGVLVSTLLPLRSPLAALKDR